MKTSELIASLQALMGEHGDAEIVVASPDEDLHGAVYVAKEVFARPRGDSAIPKERWTEDDKETVIIIG